MIRTTPRSPLLLICLRFLVMFQNAWLILDFKHQLMILKIHPRSWKDFLDLLMSFNSFIFADQLRNCKILQLMDLLLRYLFKTSITNGNRSLWHKKWWILHQEKTSLKKMYHGVALRTLPLMKSSLQWLLVDWQHIDSLKSAVHLSLLFGITSKNAYVPSTIQTEVVGTWQWSCVSCGLWVDE